MKTQKIPGYQAILQALDEEMHRDDNIIFMRTDKEVVGSGQIAQQLFGKWGPKRVLDTPHPFQNDLNYPVTLGRTKGGYSPIREVIEEAAVFFEEGYLSSETDGFSQGKKKEKNFPVVIRGVLDPLSKVCSAHEQHSLFELLPQWLIVMPSNPYDAKGLLKMAIRHPQPVLFLEQEEVYFSEMSIPEEEYLLALGKARIVKKGKCLTLVTYGDLVGICKRALETLELSENYRVEIIDLRTIKPIDWHTLSLSIEKTRHCLVVEKPTLFGGNTSGIKDLIENFSQVRQSCSVSHLQVFDAQKPEWKDFSSSMPQVEVDEIMQKELKRTIGEMLS